MKLGYCRVSTKEQNLDLQIDALKKEGCTEIYKDQVSGVKSERPQLNKLIENLRAGDVLIVWKLDRLGRSLTDLIKLINQLGEKKLDSKV